jgi:hypothetical protein
VAAFIATFFAIAFAPCLWDFLKRKQKHPVSSIQREARERVIRDYGALVASNPPLPTRIEDTSMLPHPKDIILDALIYEIGRGYAANVEESLIGCAITLAQYQVGVGNKPLEMLSLDLVRTPKPTNLEELRQLAKRSVEISEKTELEFKKFNVLVENDLKIILSKIESARMKR